MGNKYIPEQTPSCCCYFSGRNPDYLIGKHVESAMRLKASQLEVLATAYLLIDGAQSNTAAYISVKPSRYLQTRLTLHCYSHGRRTAKYAIAFIWMPAGLRNLKWKR